MDVYLSKWTLQGSAQQPFGMLSQEWQFQKDYFYKALMVYFQIIICIMLSDDRVEFELGMILGKVSWIFYLHSVDLYIYIFDIGREVIVVSILV